MLHVLPSAFFYETASIKLANDMRDSERPATTRMSESKYPSATPVECVHTRTFGSQICKVSYILGDVPE